MYSLTLPMFNYEFFVRVLIKKISNFEITFRIFIPSDSKDNFLRFFFFLVICDSY